MPLSDLLTEACLSQAALANLSDVSQSMICDLLKGNRRPGLDIARKLAEALSFALDRVVTVDDVFPPIAETAHDGESHD